METISKSSSSESNALYLLEFKEDGESFTMSPKVGVPFGVGRKPSRSVAMLSSFDCNVDSLSFLFLLLVSLVSDRVLTEGDLCWYVQKTRKLVLIYLQ